MRSNNIPNCICVRLCPSCMTDRLTNRPFAGSFIVPIPSPLNGGYGKFLLETLSFSSFCLKMLLFLYEIHFIHTI